MYDDFTTPAATTIAARALKAEQKAKRSLADVRRSLDELERLLSSRHTVTTLPEKLAALVAELAGAVEARHVLLDAAARVDAGI